MNGTHSRTLALARAAARRATARDLLRRSGRAALAGAVIAAALVIVDRLVGGLAPWPWLAIAPVAVLVSAACAWTLARRSSPIEAVGEVDRALGLRDRLSSAVALSLASARQDPIFTRWAVADAESTAGGVRLRRVMPLRPEWTWIAWPLLSAASIAAVFLVPALTWKQSSPEAIRQTAAREAAAQQVAAATEAAREALEAGPPEPATAEQLAALEELEAELARGQISPETARVKAARELDQLAGSLEQEARQRALEREALRERLAAAPSPDPDRARRGPASPLEDALRRGDLPGAARAAEDLAEQLDRLTPEEQRALSEDLEALAETLRSQGETAPPPAPPEPPAGLTPEQAERLEQETNPEEIVRELERSGYDPESARRQAERVAKENRERQAEQAAREQSEQIEQSLREAAEEARRQAEQPPGPPDRPDAQPPQGDPRQPEAPSGEPPDRQPGEQRQPTEPPSGEPQPGERPGQEPGQQPQPQPAPTPGEQPGEPQPAPEQGQGEQPDQQPGEQPQPQPTAPPRPQPGDGQLPEGEPPSEQGVQRLRQTLERFSRSQEDAQRRFEQSERLREMSRQMMEQATPEERDQLRRWAESFQGERPDLPPAPARPWTGATEPVDARPPADPADPQRPDSERVIAEWYSDRTPDPDGRVPAPAQGELREAARSAEQAIEQQVVPNRYADLVRRVFRRYGERAEPPPGPER